MRDWIEAKAPTFDFAMSMKNALRRYGTLTVNQAAAVERCMARDAAAQRPAVAVQTFKSGGWEAFTPNQNGDINATLDDVLERTAKPMQ